MTKSKGSKNYMRLLHRYIGFFMAGIMTVYALSGILLIYRDTDFLKKEKKYNDKINPNLNAGAMGKAIKMRDIEFTKVSNDTAYFKNGWYHTISGTVNYTKKELPYVVSKFVNLHKSKSADTLSPLNALFGVSLFFFVISSFWMYPLKSKILKKGLLYTTIGLVFSIILLFIY